MTSLDGDFWLEPVTEYCLYKFFPDDLIVSNDIAKDLGVSITTVNTTLKKLEEKNLIKIKIVYHKKTKIALGKEIELKVAV